MVVFRKWNYLIFCIKVRSIRFATLPAFMCEISKFLKTLLWMPSCNCSKPWRWNRLIIPWLSLSPLDYLKTQVRRENTKDDLIQWKQRELAIRISNLEGCNPSYIFSQEIKSIVMKTLNQLPKQTQKVFIMSRFENKSGKEIAQILGISVKGVDYHMNKALKELRIALKDYLPVLIWLCLTELINEG